MIFAVALATVACAPRKHEQTGDSTALAVQREILRDEANRTLGVLVGKTLYISGIEPSEAEAPIGDQTKSAMERLGEVLSKESLDYSNVVSCHVHLSNMEDYADMNSAYGSYFKQGAYPARTTIEVGGLPRDSGVLLMCVAYTDSAEIAVVRPPASEIPPAMGPYSPAVRAGPTVYLSGQGGRDPATGEIAESAGAQAEQTLQTIGIILRAASLGYDNTVLASSYLPPSSSIEEIDRVFENLFSPGGAPSRATVGLSRLPGDIAVEITFVAVDDDYVTRLFMHDQPASALSSPASLSGKVIYTSATPGQGATFGEQTQHALETQAAVLRLALMDFPNVVRVTAYLSDLANLGELQAALSQAFPDAMPALVTIQARNPADTAVSLEMIAVQ